MSNHLGKILGALCLTLLILPAAQAEDLKFDSYQRVKNITINDDPSGSTYTLGKQGDELRHLLFIYNTDNFERSYQVNLNLPRYLNVTKNSQQIYRQESWQDAPEAVNNFEVSLQPFEFIYYKFSSTVTDEVPNENIILSIVANVQDDQGGSKTTVNKIYVANYQEDITNTSEYQELSDEEQAHVQKVLQEEADIIEKQFASFLEEEQNEAQELNLNADYAAEDNSPENSQILILAICSAIFFIGFYFIKNEKSK